MRENWQVQQPIRGGVYHLEANPKLQAHYIRGLEFPKASEEANIIYIANSTKPAN
jgi:hypothetical protein